MKVNLVLELNVVVFAVLLLDKKNSCFSRIRGFPLPEIEVLSFNSIREFVCISKQSQLLLQNRDRIPSPISRLRFFPSIQFLYFASLNCCVRLKVVPECFNPEPSIKREGETERERKREREREREIKLSFEIQISLTNTLDDITMTAGTTNKK